MSKLNKRGLKLKSRLKAKKNSTKKRYYQPRLPTALARRIKKSKKA